MECRSSRAPAAVRQRMSPSQEKIRIIGWAVGHYPLDIKGQFERVPNGPSEQLRRRPGFERVFGSMRARCGAQPLAKNGWIPGLQRPDRRKRSGFADVVLAERQELSPNLLCVIFQWLITTYFLTEMWGTMDSPRYPQTRRAASNVVFDPDLEQGGNINVVVRRDPATGDMTRVLVHRWCRPARGRPRTGWPMLEPYPTPGSNPSHNRAARVTGAKLLRAVVWHRQRFCQRPA